MAPQEVTERPDVEVAAPGPVALKEEAGVQGGEGVTPEVSSVGSAGEVDYDKLWYIHGQAYDLQANGWLDRHPGGAYALLNCRGMDVTALFEAYHPFTDRPRARLASFTPVAVPDAVLKLKVADRSQGNWFKQEDGSNDPFWETLRQRCGQVVREQKIPRTMSWQCLWFHIFLLACQPVAYYFGFLNHNFWIALATSSLMGTTTWIAGRLGHDGGHYELFRGKFTFLTQIVGNWAGLGLSNIGYWELLHTIMHHNDTNAEGADPDLYHYFYVLRDTPTEKWNRFHSLQASKLWCYGVWSLTTMGLLIVEPILLLLSGAGTIPGTPFKKVVLRRYQWFKLVVHLLAFPAWMLVLPIWYNWDTYGDNKGLVIGLRLLCFWNYLTTSGFWFGLFSQVNHFAEGCVDAASKPTSWAVRQVETAANFSVDSLFWSIMTAGINIQIEHHLFPGVSSDRLHPLVPVVRQTCKEFGVDYKNFPTFSSCLASVHKFMEQLAKREYKPSVRPALAATTTATSTTTSQQS